jgi:hypothetical protein
MGPLTIARCHHCEAPLPARPPGRAGRPRIFCSERCKRAAYRARRQPRELEPYPIGDLELPPLPPAPSPDELMAQALAQARDVAASFALLAQVARRSLAWRCELAAADMMRTLDEHFPGV